MKKVVLGVTGCIGAYKAPDLVRALRKRDLRVQVIVTRAAREFVSPLALGTVSGEPVLEDLFSDVPGEAGGEGPDPTGGVRHISLTEETDVFLVAPATAHVIARMALGLADDFLTTFHLAVRAPILIAPAMNTNMLTHEATQGHLRTLRERGATIIEPGEGELACGWL
ncbi:MAG: phosphopantothenoylcysteine decarboxylase, partial [Acidobacteria bacterium]|nr:phosphopantothenoylcysteine decarboxylase [Acidobacteriota bacterium]